MLQQPGTSWPSQRLDPRPDSDKPKLTVKSSGHLIHGPSQLSRLFNQNDTSNSVDKERAAASNRPPQLNTSKGYLLSKNQYSPKSNSRSGIASPTAQANAPSPAALDCSSAVQDSSNVTLAERYLANHPLQPNFAAKYTILSELGSGGYGFVCSALRHADKLEVAVKFIFRHKMPSHHWTQDSELGMIPIEVFLLRHLHHLNVIGFVDYFEDQMFFYLVMDIHGKPWSDKQEASGAVQAPIPMSPLGTSPRIGRGSSQDLFEAIEQHQFFSERIGRHIFRQIVAAIAYLHSCRVVHRDIKDENILLDQNFNVKIIDLGSATVVPAMSFDENIPYAWKMQNKCAVFDRFYGTIQYAAPEILKGHNYHGPSSDIWSMGCCLFVVLFGQVPFTSPSAALQARFSVNPDNCTRISRSCWHLLKRMLEPNPAERAVMREIVNSPWLQEGSVSNSPTTSTHS